MKTRTFKEIIKKSVDNWSTDTKEIKFINDELIAIMEDGSQLKVTVEQIKPRDNNGYINYQED